MSATVEISSKGCQAVAKSHRIFFLNGHNSWTKIPTKVRRISKAQTSELCKRRLKAPCAAAFEIDFQKSYFPALVVYHPDCISRCLLWQGEMMMNQNPILNFLTLQIAAYAWWPRVGRYKQRETVALFFWEVPVAVNTISRATYLDSSSIPAVPKRLVLSMMEGRFNIKVVM